MKRRQLLRYAQTAALVALGSELGFSLRSTSSARAQANPDLTITWLGHTCFLVSGAGRRLLLNPFLPGGCTAGYRPPRVKADLVLVSSLLLDEGYVQNLEGDPRVLADPGDFQLASGFKITGLRTLHDREGGRRFGTNICWKWEQGGVRFLSLGGIAAPITVEQQILMGRPDVLFIPVGNGLKAYGPQDAKTAIETLKPKWVFPSHFRTAAAQDPCDIVPLQEFLDVMSGVPIQRATSNQITVSAAGLPKEGPVIQVLATPPLA